MSLRPIRQSTSDTSIAVGLLLLRGAGLLLALTFGRQKIVGYVQLIHAGHSLASSGLAPLIAAVGLPAPGFLGVCAALNESVGAFLVAVGLVTRPAAAIGVLGMAVAMYVSVRLGEDFLRAALYLIIFAGVAVAGPGRLSIDYALQRRAWTGIDSL